jgi:hypothetical protein
MRFLYAQALFAAFHVIHNPDMAAVNFWGGKVTVAQPLYNWTAPVSTLAPLLS